MPVALPVPMPAVAAFQRRDSSDHTGVGEIVAVSTAGDADLCVFLHAEYIGADTTRPLYEVVIRQSSQDPLTMKAVRNLRRLVSLIETGYVPPTPSGEELDELNRIVAARGVPDDRDAWIRKLSQDVADLVD